MTKPRIPERIRALHPYQPGRPIAEVERELGLSGTIKLASNENALGPSPKALDAIRDAAAEIHMYPEGSAVLLARKLAAKLGVGVEHLVFGTGSNEMIELVARVFAGPGDEIVTSEDAFVIYKLVAQAVGAKSVAVPAADHRHDLDAIAEAVTADTKIVFLANPNNPTGTYFGEDAWQRFLAGAPRDLVIVVDQAYFEYADAADYPAVVDDLPAHPGLVVLRTFSKAYGLAGLRLGYAIASAEIADAMNRLRQPFNTTSLAQAAALAALDDVEHIERSRELVKKGRRRFAEALDALGLEWIESQANFVLVGVGDGDAVTQELLSRGVIVRPMAAYGMNDKIRITFGTEAENERCLDALSEVVSSRTGAGE